MRNLDRTAIACMLLAAALPASADVLSFTGSVTGESTFVGLDPTCVAPEIFRTAIDPASTTGTSSLGDFTFGTSTWLAPGGALASGTFIIRSMAPGTKLGSIRGLPMPSIRDPRSLVAPLPKESVLEAKTVPVPLWAPRRSVV